MTVLIGIIVAVTLMLSLPVFSTDEVITVKNDTQLINLLADIESGAVSESAVIRLENDIDLAGKPVMLTKEFCGVLDGNGKTISGMSQPLFKQFNGSVSDLTLYGVIDAKQDGFPDKRKAASFALNMQDATAVGLVSYVHIKTKASDVNGGGICGYAKGENLFVDCAYYGEYEVEWNGSNAGVGGIVGWSNPNGKTVSFEHCRFGGKITVTGGVANASAWIGGILGNESQAAVSLNNCISEGLVVSGITDGTDYVGGLLGISRSSSNSIDRCVNKSDVTALVNAGGIVGGLIDDVTITSCVNHGAIGAKNSGGVCGIGEGAVLICQSVIDFSGAGKLCSTEANSIDSFTSDLLEFNKTVTINGVEYDRYNLCTIEKASGLPVPTLVTDDTFEAYVSTREDGATQSLRFLIVTNCDFDTAVTVSIRFLDWDGKVMKTYHGKLGGRDSDLALYAMAMAGDDCYFAGQNCALFGCVITDIPVGVWQTVDLTVTDAENGSVYLAPVEVKGRALPLTIESLPDLSSLGKVKGVYNCGPGLESDRLDFTEEDSYMAVFSPLLKAKFDAYVASLSDYGYHFVSKTTLDGDDYYTYSKYESFIYLYYNHRTGTARIMTDNSSDPLSEISYQYEKKSGEYAAFYQYSLNYENNNIAGYDPIEYAEEAKLSCGMLYIMKTPDNKVILVDSGHGVHSTKASRRGLLDFLREITGTPEDKKVEIATWYFTHAHGDHVILAGDFLGEYYDQVNLHSVIYNFPSYHVITESYDNGTFSLKDNLHKYFPDVIYHKLHTGEILNFGGVMMEVVYTHEDAVSAFGETKVEQFNCSSTVARFTIDGATAMLLGDIGKVAEKEIVAMHSADYLKSNLVQASHHGTNYLDKLYPMIRAEIAVFPKEKYAIKVHFNKIYQIIMQYASQEYFAHKYTYKFVVENGNFKVEALPRYDQRTMILYE